MVTATSPQVAGRELDAEVARRVMGQVPCDAWRPWNMGSAGGPVMSISMDGDSRCPNGHDHGRCYAATPNGPAGGCPHYSTDIQAAWEVVEHLSILYRVEVYELDSGWVCKLTTRDTMPAVSLDGKQTRMYHGELGGGGSGLAPKTTAPFAICQAALRAAEYERRGNH